MSRPIKPSICPSPLLHYWQVNYILGWQNLRKQALPVKVVNDVAFVHHGRCGKRFAVRTRWRNDGAYSGAVIAAYKQQAA
jgi:hypothetical protein